MLHYVNIDGKTFLSLSETPATTTNEIDPEGKFSVRAQNSVNSSGSWACNVETLDPVTCDKTAVQIDNGRLELEVKICTFYKFQNF